ncbi:MAG: ABC transporter ATP-binding protein/permease [Treponema sp.]|jgi:ATP-binding cassette subfamily B protein|nr:ABC transporter ATP-binding protein/permease [Treponema sp.]
MSHASKTRFKKFISYYKPYRFLFAADVAAAVTVSALSLILPFCVRRVTALALGGKGGDPGIFTMALLMLGLVIIQTGCALFYDHKGHVMGARMERDMRNDLFAHYQRLPFSFFDREKTGTIISRLTGDLLSIAELAHHGPEDIIIYLATFTGALAILMKINLSLALAVCAFLPFMFGFSYVYSRKLRSVFSQCYEKIAGVNARIEDSISGIRTVKSFGNEALEIARFKKTNEEYFQSRASIYKHEARYYTTIGTLFTQLILVSTVVLGGMKLSGASLEVEDFISFILYVNYLTAPIPQLARIMGQYQQGISGFNRFMDVMDTAGETPVGETPVGETPVGETPAGETPVGEIRRGRAAPVGVKGEVEFSAVSFRYSPETDYILKDLSFTVKSGEYAALTGPSGIGKTTLCSLIPRFYEVTSGSILLDGRDIRSIGLESLRKHIGIVRQDVYLFAGTIRENIAYGKPGATGEEIVRAAKQANAHDFITAMPGGYDALIGPQGVTLSGGQRQRLSIARVFLKDPAILIFDEATSALDYESERIIQESLKRLSQGRTSFIIAHRLSTIKDAGRTLVFDGQEIREQNGSERLIRN